MVAMARAAMVGGAAAIRANYPHDVRGIKQALPLPVIGIYKKRFENSPIYITPTLNEVQAIVEAGADIVAVELTDQPRPDGRTNAEFISQIRTAFPDLPLMADISTLAEGLAAADLQVDLISTTMSGYTNYSRKMEGPDLDLVEQLSRSVSVPVIAEGRISCPEDAQRAIHAGAHAVVVGTAITRPQTVTGWYAQALRTVESRSAD